MPTYLSQILAVKNGIKSQTYAELTEAHHRLQKPAPMSGISRTYEKINDLDPDLPPESTRVQFTANEVIDEVKLSLTRMFDVTATSEWADTEAKADVRVNGSVLLQDVPATYLLFLEKQLNDLTTFIQKLPVLDPSEDWSWSSEANAYESKPVKTTKTQKKMRNHVKAWPTAEHPNIVPQVETFTEDEVVGYWRRVLYSGAMEAEDVHNMLERVRETQAAVKYAREEANRTVVEQKAVGKKILDYIFG